MIIHVNTSLNLLPYGTVFTYFAIGLKLTCVSVGKVPWRRRLLCLVLRPPRPPPPYRRPRCHGPRQRSRCRAHTNRRMPFVESGKRYLVSSPQLPYTHLLHNIFSILLDFARLLRNELETTSCTLTTKCAIKNSVILNYSKSIAVSHK